MKRKTLALCVSGYHSESESKIIQEIIRCCKESDINLLIFISLMKRGNFPKGIDLKSNLVRGESQIFKFINYNLVDGVMIFSSTFYNPEIALEINKKCQKKGIPIVNVNSPSLKLAYNVTIQNSFAMELVIEHLIKVHKLTKINFIGGYPDNKETIERLNAYKTILTKYNIPIEEKRIKYGHFWKESVNCVKEFEKDGLPQAIVCASDTMAILVSDYLKNAGYRLPKDIIVTGYDGISDADKYEPSLTTVRPKFWQAGRAAFELMEMLLRNEEYIPENISIGSELIIQESCGCKRHRKLIHNYIDERYSQQYVNQNFNLQMVRADILFSDEQSPDDLFNHISMPLEVFGFKKFAYLIDADLENKEINFFEEKKKNNNPLQLIEHIPYYTNISENNSFSSKKMLGYDFLNGEEAVCQCFSPLYFRNRNLGYIAYEMEDFETFDADNFQLWTFNASEKIGTFYLTRSLEFSNEKDHLTGLYNRRGMENHFEKVKQELKGKSEYISIICIDIDFLKQINDKYGHEGGDNAIFQTANAIKFAFAKKSICVRTGGDEFCILNHSEKRTRVEKSIRKMHEFLDEYNSKSGLPYKVMFSAGYFTLYSEDMIPFKEMQRKADEMLYKEKDINHKNASLKY